jgi:hypothetical protein
VVLLRPLFFGGFAVEPAYHIPLTERDLALIGEICAIQGQIEYLMQNSIGTMLRVSHDAQVSITTASPSLRALANIFINVARCKCIEDDLKALAESIFAQIEDLSKGRNDFVHAIYGEDGPQLSFGLSAGLGKPIPVAPVAVRTSSRKKRPATELNIVRDAAAQTSQLLYRFYLDVLRRRAASMAR